RDKKQNHVKHRVHFTSIVDQARRQSRYSPGKYRSPGRFGQPSIDSVSGRGVLVKILRVGLDGIDKDVNVNTARDGAAPAGKVRLVTGPEGCGQAEAVGSNVTEFPRRGSYHRRRPPTGRVFTSHDHKRQ